MFAYNVSRARRFTSHLSSRPSCGLLRGRFSSSVRPIPAIRILYGSQTGTAQLFAIQLADCLDEKGMKNVTVHALDELPPKEVFYPGGLHLVLASSTGRGEPPDNARKFYDWITKDPSAKLDGNVNFAVFGLGNKSAHPNNYNVIGKLLDDRLGEIGAHRITDIALGDDGGCIEGDFDEWVGNIMSNLTGWEDSQDGSSITSEKDDEEERGLGKGSADVSLSLSESQVEPHPKTPATANARERLSLKRHPPLSLDRAESDVVRRDLFHLSGSNRFYAENTENLQVIDNHILAPDAGESALREIRVSLKCKSAEHILKV